MANTLGAFVGVNNVNLVPRRYGTVWAFGFAYVAVYAIVGDYQGHLGHFSR